LAKAGVKKVNGYLKSFKKVQEIKHSFQQDSYAC